MRDKNLVFLGLTLIVLVGIMASASAELIISQPKASYNLGDEFEITVQADVIKENYLDVNLLCIGSLGEPREINLYHGILTEKTILINRKLIPVFISDLKGTCNIEAKYGEDLQTTQNFKISDEIIVELELNEMKYRAGEEVIIKGTAMKKNNALIGQGGAGAYVTAKIGEESKANGMVKDGQFRLNFSVLESTPAGMKALVIEVHDEDAEGNILNVGTARADLTILQEPAWMDIAVDKQVVSAGETIKIMPILYDKANMEMNGEEVVIRVLNADKKVMYEKIISSGEEIDFTLESSHAPGYSKIIAAKGSIVKEKTFDVSETPKISSRVENNTLIIENIGNCDYSGPIEIAIGGSIIVKEVNLKKGEIIRYKVSAPDGDYALTVKDNSGLIHESSGVALTGAAIGVDEIGGKMSILLRYPLVWIFLIIVIGATAFVLYKNNRKRNTYSFPFESGQRLHVGFKKREGAEMPEAGEQRQEGIRHENAEQRNEPHKGIMGLVRENNVIRVGGITKAESVLSLSGERSNSAIIAIKIKNSISKEARAKINKALENAYEMKGAASNMGNSILIVFAPLLTKTMKNSELAIKAANKIDMELKDFNSKFKDKINYGIGVNYGDLIAKREADILQFASLGNTINKAKRIADIAREGLLISKEAHERAINEIKTDKAIEESKTAKMELFKIKRIVDNEKSQQFVRDFLAKNKESFA